MSGLTSNNASSISASAAAYGGGHSSVYSDLQGLESIKQLGQVDENAALAEVSKQFESILVNMMLKNMRSATNVLSEGSYLGGDQVSFYQEMLDDQWSVELTRGAGLGFAEPMAQQLGGDRAIPKDDGVTSAAMSIEQILSGVRITKQRSEFIAPVTSATTFKNAQPLGSSPNFATPEAFVKELYDSAEQAANKLGVAPSTLLAQSALETGWGQHLPSGKEGQHGFNLFGIKADDRWSGPVTQVETVEYFAGQLIKVNANFRRYDSFEQSFNDYVDFVSSQSRYQPALEQATDAAGYIQALQAAGYATDPQYAEKVQAILNRDIFNKASLDAVSFSLSEQQPHG
ncbi:flagellar assembly peptidoglycan hydrolase FlgJ [Pseudomonadales bacterium]|nr:flagellar assembly peptidoglycan hydrolase FlgJ [Pseudomonadales bacterium]